MFLQKVGRGQLKCDGTHAETRSRLSAKRTSPFKSARSSVQSTTGSRGVRIGDSTPCSEVVSRVLATYRIRQFPLDFPSHTSLCAITYQLESTYLPTSSHGVTCYKTLPSRHSSPTEPQI